MSGDSRLLNSVGARLPAIGWRIRYIQVAEKNYRGQPRAYRQRAHHAGNKKPDDPAQGGGSIGRCTQERFKCQGRVDEREDDYAPGLTDD
jgi:hypothetical protein